MKITVMNCISKQNFFVEKLHIYLFNGNKRTNLASINFNDIPENGVLLINPSNYVVYLYLDNLKPKNEDEKKSLIQ